MDRVVTKDRDVLGGVAVFMGTRVPFQSLLDYLGGECVPRKFKNNLGSHLCSTVPDEGLAGTKNGESLIAAERLGFELFVTIDQGIVYRQNLSGRKIAILVLQPKTSRLVDLLVLAPECLAQMRSINAGELRIVSS
ncbi:MAG TPA: hypothetical protein VII23_08975 [Terriglobales bacterium]